VEPVTRTVIGITPDLFQATSCRLERQIDLFFCVETWH